MRAVHKRYLREFVPAMAGYAVLIVMSGFLMPETRSLPLRTVLALLPVLLALHAMVRVLRDQGGLERCIDLESFAIAAMATGSGFFSFGIAKLLVFRCYRNHA